MDNIKEQWDAFCRQNNFLISVPADKALAFFQGKVLPAYIAAIKQKQQQVRQLEEDKKILLATIGEYSARNSALLLQNQHENHEKSNQFVTGS